MCFFEIRWGIVGNFEEIGPCAREENRGKLGYCLVVF
jgi:hypothetical protein